MNINNARSWNKHDLAKIVAENLTEYKSLEFKSLEALHPEAKDEISKDVSSFANSGGGVIIYGIAEKKDGLQIHLELEEGIESNSRYGKEWLENIIDSRISPRIDGLYINPIILTTNKYAYVVVIPQSTTAHMAGNNRYYKRHNFKTEPMEDYEVRDVMNRLGKPRLRLLFTAPKNISENSFHLELVIRNVGEAFVLHFAVRVCIPECIIKDRDFKGGRRVQLENHWYREYVKQSNPNQYIFQGFRTSVDHKFLPTLDALATIENSQLNIYWNLYTDKGSPHNGQTPINVMIRNRLHFNN